MTHQRLLRAASAVALTALALIDLLGCASRPAIVSSGAPRAGVQGTTVSRAPDSRLSTIIQDGLSAQSHVVNDLNYLSDVLGPRLSGSKNLERAQTWVRRKLAEYGTDSVWSEPYSFGRAWSRGSIVLRIVAPYEGFIQGASWGWAPGTSGPEVGDVVLVSSRTERDFAARYAGRVRGKWVMLFKPYPMVNPDGPALSATDSVALDAQARAVTNVATTDEERAYQRGLRARLAQEGISGILRDASKDYGLLNMSGSPVTQYPYPVIVLPHETYAQLARLSDRREPVRLEATITNSFSRDSIVVLLNTFADLRGRELPNEIVIIAAHLDSWDLGTGATDNGVGVAVVLEAARLIRAAGRPRRTVRFALFTGEEQGILGSTAYVAAHTRDMKDLQAVLTLDQGTGRITGVALQGREDLRGLWESFLVPLCSLGPFHIQNIEKFGADHVPFAAVGVPAFIPDQEPRGYDHTHHSQIDTFDHIVAADVRQAATVMAAFAFELADMPSRIVHTTPAAAGR